MYSPAYFERHGAIARPADLLDRVLIDLDDDHWNWINWRVWLTERTVDLPLDKPGELPVGLRRLVINSYPLIVQAARDGLGVALG